LGKERSCFSWKRRTEKKRFTYTFLRGEGGKKEEKKLFGGLLKGSGGSRGKKKKLGEGGREEDFSLGREERRRDYRNFYKRRKEIGTKGEKKKEEESL